MKKILLFAVITLILLSSIVSAKVFYYSDEVDRRDNLAYAYANPYDSIDPADVGDFDKYNCISLGDYNSFARSDPYDSYDPLTAENIRKKDLSRLSRDDFNKIANEDPYDAIDPDYFNDYSDMQCWNLKDYNGFAETKPRDKWDPVYFRDFDDLDTVSKVGSARYHFFGEDDFDDFDLYDIKPRARAEIYYPGFYEEYRPYYYDSYGRYDVYPLFGYGYNMY